MDNLLRVNIEDINKVIRRRGGEGSGLVSAMILMDDSTGYSLHRRENKVQRIENKRQSTPISTCITSLSTKS